MVLKKNLNFSVQKLVRMNQRDLTCTVGFLFTIRITVSEISFSDKNHHHETEENSNCAQAAEALCRSEELLLALIDFTSSKPFNNMNRKLISIYKKIAKYLWNF